MDLVYYSLKMGLYFRGIGNIIGAMG